MRRIILLFVGVAVVALLGGCVFVLWDSFRNKRGVTRVATASELPFGGDELRNLGCQGDLEYAWESDGFRGRSVVFGHTTEAGFQRFFDQYKLRESMVRYAGVLHTVKEIGPPEWPSPTWGADAFGAVGRTIDGRSVDIVFDPETGVFFAEFHDEHEH
jgi:hypothetical protein